MKVLGLCLLLIDISASMKIILDNICVIISMKKYDTDTSLSFSSHDTVVGFINLITK